jgi:amino acid transporter
MDDSAKQAKKISALTLAFMAFSTVWGFGNVCNGFNYFDGTHVIFSWVLMFALYFVPYALMVGELGSTFKNAEGGVSSWVNATMGPKLAYFAGWTYWAVHIPYIAGKGTGGLRAFYWAIFQNTDALDKAKTMWVQLATLAIFLLFCWLASRGITTLKILTTVAGSATFILSLLYIVMMLAAPAINHHASFYTINWNIKSFMPNFNVKYFTSLSILVFAVGGCEKISPYVNQMRKPSKDFPRGMITLAIMVMVCAILGTIAMARMFDPAQVAKNFDAYVSNADYWAFQKLGNYYHLGNLFLIIYAWSNVIGQLAVLLLSIDAPLRMLLGSKTAADYIPSGLLKKNKHGAYYNGIKMVAVLAGSLILVQAVVPGATKVMSQLIKLNSIAMPMRYLWVFAAYIALRKQLSKFHSEYHFVNNNGVAKFFGYWCFGVTAICCLLGVYSSDPFTLCLNIATPVILFLLGIILPEICERQVAKNA